MKYTIENYHRNNVFSSFLPGISGPLGIPIWAFYVNRGQAISSFGIQNKDRSIMDFDSAHIAYKTVEKEGFRTFIKHGSSYHEPFTYDTKTKMIIGTNDLEIYSQSEEFEVKITYMPMMNEAFPALIRKVDIKAYRDYENLEVYDGMSELIPYGLNQDVLKNIPQTVSAWMEVERLNGVPLFRTRISIEDHAEVKHNRQSHYYLSIHDHQLSQIKVDPKQIFGTDRSFDKPYGIFEEIEPERLQNYFPSAFTYISTDVKKDETISFYSVIGYLDDNSELNDLLEIVLDDSFIDNQLNVNNELMEGLLNTVNTKTGNSDFDAYIKQSYLDNFLRGGYPYVFENNKPIYVYGRKHGDLERDYNYFEIEDSYFSSGNGNYRDVNQNRRNDLFFNPKINDSNIKQFLTLIQLDGYNPLVIEPNKFLYDGGMKLSDFVKNPEELVLQEPFTFSEIIKDVELKVDLELFIIELLNHSSVIFEASFQEGYWVDHWTYNIDLIEDYLALYPDKIDLFLTDCSYYWFHSPAYVKPRSERYKETSKGLRQYNSLEYVNTTQKYVLDENGDISSSTVLEKLLHLHAMKLACLDPHGVGIEMEADKPGWYDALNGLPGILGSSVMDFYELIRLNSLLNTLLDRTSCNTFTLHFELLKFMNEISELAQSNLNALDYWEKVNTLKEEFRKNNRTVLKSQKVSCQKSHLKKNLSAMRKRLDKGLNILENSGELLFHSYFYYDKEFKQYALPPFLEGAVKYMGISKQTKTIHQQVLYESKLYDKKLKMFKVNAPLDSMTLELGRCMAFTPGWLENESIWMHMSYKYLLSLLENKEYEIFSKHFQNAAIPFLNEEIYGRSIWENVSFIASSANPDPSIHGRGFIARLSGSTAEILSIWKLMFLGKDIYGYNDQLYFKLEPMIPSYLMSSTGIIETQLHSKTQVVYIYEDKYNLIPNEYTVDKYILEFQNETVEVNNAIVLGKLAERIRNQECSRMTVIIK